MATDILLCRHKIIVHAFPGGTKHVPVMCRSCFLCFVIYSLYIYICFNYCSLWWQSKVSCILSLSFYSGCKSPLCCKQCFQNHSTLFPPICYHTECWALQYCAFNSNLICSSLSDVNFALVIPFFLARWLQCKQHYISWLLIPDYTIEIANNVRVIK